MIDDDVDNAESKFTRRHFAGVSAVGVAALAAVNSSDARATPESKSNKMFIKPGAAILFQGDSITDCRRKRDVAEPNLQAALGDGYAWLAASQLLVDRPDDQLNIFNRGISGNKVPQLGERWKADCLDLKPDIVSILVGTNDIWHTLEKSYDGTPTKYENGYRKLLEQTKATLPDVRLVICEPFVLRCGLVDGVWFPAFDKMRAAAKRLAHEFQAAFVPFQAMFDTAAKVAPPERWAADGVHPTADGAALMAHTWRRVVDGTPS
ncbi:MAG: SGNH/GDSL hydrolase family protein [Pirellulales bacterium]|nr:SGNH/GDSL hydrolase family protein [Pirellulales bacterium]